MSTHETLKDAATLFVDATAAALIGKAVSEAYDTNVLRSYRYNPDGTKTSDEEQRKHRGRARFWQLAFLVAGMAMFVGRVYVSPKRSRRGASGRVIAAAAQDAMMS